LFEKTQQRFDYERFEHKVTDDELGLFKLGDPEKIINFSPDFACGKIIYCGFNGTVLTGVYEKPCSNSISPQNYKIFFPLNINALRPRDWDKVNYYPNNELLQFLNTKLDLGFILEKIIVNQFIFRPLSKTEKKPSYCIIDRDSENYHPLNYKNSEILQYLLDSNSQKGFRFLGGFFGARMDTGTEYSGWIFISQPNADSSRYFVLPSYQKYTDLYFCYDPSFIQTLQLWTQSGWDLISILFSIKKEEKALQYYPITKFIPFLVLRQPKPIKGIDCEKPSIKSSPELGGLIIQDNTENYINNKEDYGKKKPTKLKGIPKAISSPIVPKISKEKYPKTSALKTDIVSPKEKKKAHQRRRE